MSHEAPGARRRRSGRARRRARLVLPVVAIATLLAARPASACSILLDYFVAEPTCGDVPEGGLVLAAESPLTFEGGVTWSEDARLTAILARSHALLSEGYVAPAATPLRAFRASGPGRASIPRSGGVLTYDAGQCTVEVTAGQPPAAPEAFGEVRPRVTYTEGGSSGAGCSCPEIDEMTIERAAPSPAERLPFVAVWFGRTAGETTPDREPDGLFSESTAAYRRTHPSVEERRFDITLGIASDHQRTGVGFGQEGRYCFRLAWMNALGELGEASPPACVDTRDQGDPSVAVEDEGACICGSPGRPHRGGLATVLVTACAVAAACRRR